MNLASVDRSLTLFASFAFVLASATAQTTWIVDKNGGPGHNFTSIAPAIAASSSGDTIVIRPGAYNEGQLTIDKGITMLGSFAVSVTLSGLGSPGITVENIPAGESFAMRSMRVGGSILAPAVLVRDCDGLVLFERLEGTLSNFGIPTELGFGFERCRQAHLHSIFVRGGAGVRFLDSRGVVTSSALEGEISWVLNTVNSHVTIDRCTISMESQQFQFTGPVIADGGKLDITRTTITAPNSPLTPHPAILATNNPSIRIDPTASVTSASGQPQVSGPAVVTTPEIVSMARINTTTGTQIELHGRTGAVFATVVSFPTAVLGLPYGDVWVNLGAGQQLPIGLGVLSQRLHQASFNTVGLPAGLVVVVQSAVLDSELTLSNGIGYVTY